MLRNMPDMIRGRSTTAADNINESIFRPIFDEMGSLFGLFIVFAHRVRQSGVGIGGDETCRDLAEFFDMGSHFTGAQGAIQTYAQWTGMHHGYIKGFQRLSAERPAAGIGNGPADGYG